MADLTSASSFVATVQGNRRVVTVDVSSAGFTTSDSVTIGHLGAITAIYGGSYRTSAA